MRAPLPYLLAISFLVGQTAAAEVKSSGKAWQMVVGRYALPSDIPFLQPLGITTPDQQAGFLRVVVRTQLQPRPDLTPEEVREAVAVYADSLAGRAGAVSKTLAPANLAALMAELRDAPIISAIAPEKAGMLERARRSAADTVAEQEAALGRSIEEAGKAWNDKKDDLSLTPRLRGVETRSDRAAAIRMLAQATPRSPRGDILARPVPAPRSRSAATHPAPSSTLAPPLSISSKKISIENAKRLLRLDSDAEAITLGALYPVLVQQAQPVSIAPLEALLADPSWHARHAAVTALGAIYPVLIQQGQPVSIAALEVRLEDSDELVRRAAVTALGAIYPVLIQQGQPITFASLEVPLHPGTRHSAATALGNIYFALVQQGRPFSVAPLEVLLRDPNRQVRLAAANALGIVYAAQIQQGRPVSIAALEALLKDSESEVRIAAATQLGTIYPTLIQQGRPVSIAALEALLKDSEWDVNVAAVTALRIIYPVLIQQGLPVSVAPLEHLLRKSIMMPWSTSGAVPTVIGTVYAALIQQGQPVSIATLDALLKDSMAGNRHAAATALGAIYPALIQQGRPVSIAALEALLKDSEGQVRIAAVTALRTIYPVLIQQGQPVSPALLEGLLRDSRVNLDAAAALGVIYAALIEQGQPISTAPLEAMLRDSPTRWTNRRAAAAALGTVFAAMARRNQFFLLPVEQKKYELWRAQSFPYEEAMIDRYFAASDSLAFIQDLKTRAETLIREGFDPADAQERGLAFFGVRMHGLFMSRKEFEERLSELVEFDKKHPGYFKALFTKTRGLPALVVSGQASRMEHGDVQAAVLDRNRDELFAIEQQMLSLDWMERDFPGSKTFTPRNLYYQLEKKRAIEEGRLRLGERFQVAFPAPEELHQELFRDSQAYFRTVFQLAGERLGDRAITGKLIRLMRDLILTDALSDPAIKRSLESGGVEERLAAFKNLYENYKNHLPDSLGIKFNAIKGLAKALEIFSQEIYAELAKTRQVTLKGEADTYRLVPQGFLSVFRGRFGMIDCSFDQNKGKPYTRAMHEDTIYYGVYKGSKPKGYIGMLIGKTQDGQRVLTIDTINSASLDGEELLNNLFRELATLAKRLDCVGIALPEDMGSSFNFHNLETIETLPIYQKAKGVEAKPIHPASWAYFSDMYGEDLYNSIEKGRFKLLE